MSIVEPGHNNTNLTTDEALKRTVEAAYNVAPEEAKEELGEQFHPDNCTYIDTLVNLIITVVIRLSMF